MPDQHAPQYRYEHAVRATAPKPGHLLATGSFQLDDRSVILSVIEGPENDALGFSGMATNFEHTRLLRFGLRGPLVERLCELPRWPYEHGLRQVFSDPRGQGPSPIGVDGAQVVFSTLRAANRPDPDSGAVAYMLPDGQQVRAAITGYQRDWAHASVGIAVAIWALKTNPAGGQQVTLAVEQDAGMDGRFEVSGAIAFRDSIVGAALAPTAPSARPAATNGHRTTDALVTEALMVST